MYSLYSSMFIHIHGRTLIAFSLVLVGTDSSVGLHNYLTADYEIK